MPKRKDREILTTPTNGFFDFLSEDSDQKQADNGLDLNLLDQDDITPFDSMPDISLDFLDDESLPVLEPKKYDEFKMFDVRPIDLTAKMVGNLILKGEEKDINEALALVRKEPNLLRCKIRARDPLGRLVEGTPLQIAAMAGDVNLKPGVADEYLGMVERLIAAGSLSKEEVIEQLKCVTSCEAMQANKARNVYVLTAITRFGDIIAKTKTRGINNLEAMQLRCKPFIDQLDRDLYPDTETVINTGYIFDPEILQKTTEWFKANIKKFNGWGSRKSDVFWVNGFGKLLTRLSSRDAQVFRAGVGYLVKDGIVPGRTLNNRDGTSFFFNKQSKLGVTFYIGYFGIPMNRAWRTGGLWHDIEVYGKSYINRKISALQNLCSRSNLTAKMIVG